MTATLPCTGAQTATPKWPVIVTDLFKWREEWIKLATLQRLGTRLYKNINDSNFTLYRGPDSNPKVTLTLGPMMLFWGVYIARHPEANDDVLVGV